MMSAKIDHQAREAQIQQFESIKKDESNHLEEYLNGLDEMYRGVAETALEIYKEQVEARKVKVINVPSDGVPLHKGVPF